MYSMTGYGRCRREMDGREVTVEIKSVNHRFLDINPRLPRGLLFAEDALRKALSERLSRGHADMVVSYRNGRADAREVLVDAALARAYSAALDTLAAATGVPDDRSLLRLAAMPDVLTVSEREEDQQAVTALCLLALDGAADALIAMRAREGEALRADLLARLGALADAAQQIAARAPEVPLAYAARLTARVTELLAAPPDPQRLAQEIALLADRAAIDEELTRLGSHIAQMREALDAGEPVGRKIDFLVQEMNREVNTIGSKASDLEIGALVVLAKAEIEKIREQVQNIE
ncbi:hypothetical protein FACS1894196_0460 [Clostridia bacterium]|nr:hypothetical protein FACS1894196_0460 [Clostridia bacterium]